MCDQSNNSHNESVQSSLSKQNSIQQKFTQEKHYRTKWRSNITNAIKHRQNVLSKALVAGGDSFIRIHGHDNDLLFRKSKRNKETDLITINVSGTRYETHLLTLESYPDTLLGNKQKRKCYWNKDKNEYFFDRHRACFQSILYYYQSNGRLRRPDYVPLDTFLEEVLFFELGPHAISQINKLENVSWIKHIDLPNSTWRRYIWYYFECPQHSIVARILHFISMILTVLSSISLAVETLPTYNGVGNDICAIGENQTSDCSSMLHSPFFLIQTICVSYFTIEFLLRLISTPSYWRFLLSIFNWIDLGAIVPYFVFLFLELFKKRTDLNESTITGLRIFRLLRFVRVFRMYLIFKQLKSLRVLTATLKESFMDFVIMIVILTLMGFLFGAATYFAEKHTNGEMFNSIPTATYWGILTITTVGYGDIYPKTVIGRTLSCSCAFIGVAISGMLVSVLVDRYQRVYKRKQYCPEQILSPIDSSDSEHQEKQDFIDRKLSGTRKSLFSGLITPRTSIPRVLSSINNQKYFNRKTSLSQVRFIISLTDDHTSNESTRQVADELMKELTGIIKNSGEQIKLKLKSSNTDTSNYRIRTTDQLSSLPDEKGF